MAAGQIIAIANQKGGVGKTTTAINLGTALAAVGRKVLILDIDPQGNASTGLGIPAVERSLSTYDLIVSQTPLARIRVPTRVPGLDIAPATTDLSSIDADLTGEPTRLHRLRRAIRDDSDTGPRGGYDYVLIDCPPSLNILTLNGMIAAHSVLVPLQCEFFALEGLSQLLITIREVRQTRNAELRTMGIVLTMYDRRNNLSAQVAADVRENLRDLVFETMIPRNVRLSEAPSHAMPAILYDHTCAGSIAYQKLAAELLAREERALDAVR
ncbi:MAG: ParA family protein [Alphaproteobacteria bacterium]|nr:MAG: ParA family protein [Alphaproteobacteria bacterium]